MIGKIEVLGQMSLFDLGGWSGKTCRAHFQAPVENERERTLDVSLKKLAELRIKPPLFLNLRREGGQQADASWATGGQLLGDYTMHSFGECPSEERESRLSQILEDPQHPISCLKKYELSPRACQGILNRAQKRGKELPKLLKITLVRQAQSMMSEYPQTERGIGGRTPMKQMYAGALTLGEQTRTATTEAPQSSTLCLNDQGGAVMDVSEDMSGTLRAQEHGHQPAVVYGIGSYDSNAMKSSNPHSGIYEAETTRTLDLNGGNPGCNQGGMMVVQGADVYNQEITGEVAATLTEASGGTNTSGPKVITVDQGGGKSSCAISENVTPTLATTHGGEPVICIEGNGTRESHKGDGYKESETMYTLNTVEQHAVCVGNGQTASLGIKDTVGTLDCMHEQQMVMTFSDTAACLNAKNGPGGVHSQKLADPEGNFVVMGRTE